MSKQHYAYTQGKDRMNMMIDKQVDSEVTDERNFMWGGTGQMLHTSYGISSQMHRHNHLFCKHEPNNLHISFTGLGIHPGMEIHKFMLQITLGRCSPVPFSPFTLSSKRHQNQFSLVLTTVTP